MPSPKPLAPTAPVHTFAIDDVALAALRSRSDEQHGAEARCDLCGAAIEQAPAASGLLLWARGDEVRADEPPLCAACAASIATVAFAAWATEDEGDE